MSELYLRDVDDLSSERVTSLHPLPVSVRELQEIAPDNTTTEGAYATNLVVRSNPGRCYGLTGYNSKASAQFIQLHDAATLPADGAYPRVTITVPATSNFSIDFGKYGRRFDAGIVICNSSTGPTKTIGSADCFFDVQHGAL